jgi:hypothetical protein
MNLIRYNPPHKGAWNLFVRSAKNGLFMFDRNYMDYHAGRFSDHSLIAFDEGLIGQKEGFGGRGVVHQFFEMNWSE